VNTVGPRPENDALPQPPDGGPPVFTLRQTGQFRGRPIYDRECTYIARRAAAPFVPVTRERFIRNRILTIRADSQRYASQMAKAGASGANASAQQFIRQGNEMLGGQIRGLEDQLASLSADERQQPVSVHGYQIFADVDFKRAELANADDPDATGVVQWNPAFFDHALPPDVPQIIWVCLPGLQEGVPPLHDQTSWDAQRARIAGQLRDQIDWAGLEQMVRP
jgi:hypothetical protein